MPAFWQSVQDFTSTKIRLTLNFQFYHILPLNFPPSSCIFNCFTHLFFFLRDKSFSAVGPALNKKTLSVSNELGERRVDQSIDQMKQFVEKLPQLMEVKKSLGIRKLLLYFHYG